MAGASIEVDARQLVTLGKSLTSLSLGLHDDLLNAISASLEDSVRERISSKDREAPDGSDWTEWSESYAKTRHGNNDLLLGEGSLLDSIMSAISGDSVEVGSNLVYAATHQFGDPGRRIPPRPYLGLSTDDERDIVDLIDEIVTGQFSLGF